MGFALPALASDAVAQTDECRGNITGSGPSSPKQGGPVVEIDALVEEEQPPSSLPKRLPWADDEDSDGLEIGPFCWAAGLGARTGKWGEPLRHLPTRPVRRRHLEGSGRGKWGEPLRHRPTRPGRKQH